MPRQIHYSYCIVFPVAYFGPALADAHAAAELHRQAISAALVAAGQEDWASQPGGDGTGYAAGPFDRLDGSSSDIFLGTLTSPIPDPPNTTRDVWVSANYYAPPS